MADQPSDVEVTQADRDAAAACIDRLHGSKDYTLERGFRSGEADSHSAIQAFARHRLSAPPSPEVEKLREALRADIATMEEQARRCARWGKSCHELNAAIAGSRALLATTPAAPEERG